ncbi:MAG TPA: histone deacetylase [Rhodospirillaceae bacterium]|nr:MAG: hypothetical protein A2018_06960 [Alphaproteobacteria bacterium GWF2_58_20]HAU29922.1 histone deacetylase [Rhodospirillaceae bacterium]
MYPVMRNVFAYLSQETFCRAPGMEDHPFFPDRHRQVLDVLLAQGVLAPDGWQQAARLSMEEVARRISPELLAQLSSEEGVAHAMCAPEGARDLRKSYVGPALAATGATQAAVFAAFRQGFAVHLGGGFHHASRTRAEGFCLLPDITLAVDALREKWPGLPVMLVDLDAHHGNGVAADFAADARTFVLDMFNADIYPRGPRPDMAAGLRVPLPSFCGDEAYLESLKMALDKAFAAFSPRLVIYNAGADVLSGDPLGRLGLSARGLARRDAMVIEAVRGRGVPACVLMAGGYSSGVVAAVADSLCGIALKFGVFRPKRPISQSPEPAPRGC